jgi:hypothetical protein
MKRTALTPASASGSGVRFSDTSRKSWEKATRAYLEQRRSSPGAAQERILDRRVRDWLIGLPPAPARRAA